MHHLPQDVHKVFFPTDLLHINIIMIRCFTKKICYIILYIITGNLYA